jgi:hypothetical protein
MLRLLTVKSIWVRYVLKHERQLPRLTRRDCQLPLLRGKIDTVIGMRRTGKGSRIFIPKSR